MIRHGKTWWNQKKKMQGQVNIPLNDVGRADAGRLAKALKQYDFDYCLSSPYSRAEETARIVLGDRKVPVVKKELLSEQNYGLCEGWYQRAVFNLPCLRLYYYQHHPERYHPPIGGESMRDMLIRGGRVITEVLRPAAEEHEMILVGGHGSIICAILDRIERLPVRQYWDNMLKNCGYAVIEYKEGKWTVLEKH